MKQPPSQLRNNYYLLLIICLVAVAQCGFALYLPSLPAITHVFHASSSEVQSTVFFYVAGISVSQWFYGPLSDYYGRRRIALWGLSLFILGSIIGLFATQLSFLLYGRGIQGLGMGAMMTVSRAILRDVFKGKTYVQNASKLASAIAISPVVFPVLGGYLQSFWGWRANFAFMLLFSLTVSVGWYVLFIESREHTGNKKMNIRDILRDYKQIARSAVFWKNTLCGGLIYSGEVIFLTMAPFLIQQNFHLTASFYGWLMFIAVVGFIFGSQASSYMAQRLKYEYLILTGLFFCFLAVLFLSIECLLEAVSIIAILSPVSLFMFGAGFVYPNTSVGAIGHFPEKAGTASALLSSVQGGIALFGTAVILAINSNTLNVLAQSFFVIVLVSSLLGASIFYQEKNRILE